MPVFETLEYWQDGCARTAAENMAVDQLLMEQADLHPVLRIYQWSEPAVSFGYFHSLQEAQRAFPSTDGCPLTYVRRWTGGGVVDHRIDLTYTLAIPRGCDFSHERGSGSYRVIHQMLGETLARLGEDIELVAVDSVHRGPVCFESPVIYDLTNAQGEKIAGAGQRRTRNGLLHQGSIVTGVGPGELGEALATHLAERVVEWIPPALFDQEVSMLAVSRYGSKEWLTRK